MHVCKKSPFTIQAIWERTCLSKGLLDLRLEAGLSWLLMCKSFHKWWTKEIINQPYGNVRCFYKWKVWHEVGNNDFLALAKPANLNFFPQLLVLCTTIYFANREFRGSEIYNLWRSSSFLQFKKYLVNPSTCRNSGFAHKWKFYQTRKK